MATEDNNVTLALLGKQMERIIEGMREIRDEQSRTRDSITVLTGICIRLEGAVTGFTLEIAGLRRMVLDHDRDIRILKESSA